MKVRELSDGSFQFLPEKHDVEYVKGGPKDFDDHPNEKRVLTEDEVAEKPWLKARKGKK